ncbi:MAG: biopolymer transporter ExbD [Deltaproteobacteria bacterium]|nr:biopolymer transporter ExbD [Deltaproteobacteria bacterium]
MAGKPTENEEMITDINVTPLVDITLVLLIIFMVTATYIVTPSIKVELPKAANSEESNPSTIAIVITKDDRTFLNGEEVSSQILVEKIKKALEHNPDVQAIISADRYVYHGKVVNIIDTVKGAGITKFAISIEKNE